MGNMLKIKKFLEMNIILMKLKNMKENIEKINIGMVLYLVNYKKNRMK